MSQDNLPYGLVAIIASVFFLIASLDLIDFLVFSKGFSAILAYVLVAIGVYDIAKKSK